MVSLQLVPKAGLALLVLCFLVNCSWIDGVKIQLEEKEELDRLLRSYDSRIRPSSSNTSAISTATVVTINPYILNIRRVDDKNMEFSVEMYFRQRWNDERLKFSDHGGTLKYIILEEPSKIWTPDIFFVNERKGATHDIMKPNHFARIYPNGDVLYSTRLTLILDCPMDLSSFPFDTQVCSINMESYGWSNEDLKLEWKEVNPVGVGEVELMTFSLVSYGTSIRYEKLKSGTYSRLSLNFVFRRQLSYYILQVFIPSMMLVILSWVTFWLDRSEVTARVLLSVAALITLANRASAFSESVAHVSYTKSVDVWLGICVTFIFSAVIETAVVHYMHRAEQKRSGKAGGDAADADEEAVEAPGKSSGNGTPSKRMSLRPSDLKNRLSKIPTVSKRVDVVSRVCFPLIFLLFAVFYWIANLLQYYAHMSAE